MARGQSVAANEAKHGEKMIEVSVRFWTNALSRRRGTVKPKHAWTSGSVRVQANKAHGIKASRPRTFNSLLDLGKAVEQTLNDNGIVLHLSKRMKKYTVL